MKTTMILTAVFAVVVCAVPVSAAIAADDPPLSMCVSCHGHDGRGTGGDVPIIAGISAVVQEDALYEYQDGDRSCGSNPLMCKIAERLSEEQITALAEHYAALPFEPAGEQFDAALAEAGKALHQAGCAICHGGDSPGDGEFSILHGQRKGYLRFALTQYAAGERKQMPAMEKKVSPLSSDDIEALVNYYASYRK